MSIQGAGISTQVAFTHRGWKAARARTSRLIARLQHRKAICTKYEISIQEYERRFAEWGNLRRVHKQIILQEESASYREDVRDMILDKRAQRVSIKARLEATRGRNRLKVDFPRRGAPVDYPK